MADTLPSRLVYDTIRLRIEGVVNPPYWRTEAVPGPVPLHVAFRGSDCYVTMPGRRLDAHGRNLLATMPDDLHFVVGEVQRKLEMWELPSDVNDAQVVGLHLARDGFTEHPWSVSSRAVGTIAFRSGRERYGWTHYLGSKYRAFVMYDKRCEVRAGGYYVGDLPRSLVRGELRLGNARAVREVAGVETAADLLAAYPRMAAIYGDRVRRYLGHTGSSTRTAAPSVAARLNTLGTGRGALQRLQREVGAVALVDAFGGVEALCDAVRDAGHGERQARHFAKQVRAGVLSGPPLRAGEVPVGTLVAELLDALTAAPRTLAPWELGARVQ